MCYFKDVSSLSQVPSGSYDTPGCSVSDEAALLHVPLLPEHGGYQSRPDSLYAEAEQLGTVIDHLNKSAAHSKHILITVSILKTHLTGNDGSYNIRMMGRNPCSPSTAGIISF